MKRFGTVTLILFAFVVGFISTYSCGGGSSAAAGDNADTLEGLPASAFALSTHNHPGYATTALLSSHVHSDYAPDNHAHGQIQILSPTAYPIDSSGFVGTYEVYYTANSVRPAYDASWLHAPVSIPFNCTITGLSAKIHDNTDTGYIAVTLRTSPGALYAQYWPDASERSDDEIIYSFPTSAFYPTITYDPATDETLSVWVLVSEVSTSLALNWVKVHYTIP